MAKTISSLSVILGATVAPFVNAFKSAENATDSFTSKIERVGSTIAKLSGITLAMNAIGSVVEKALSIPSEAIAAAGEAADGHARLAAVLKATGNAAGFTTEQLLAQADAFKAVTTFDDDDIVKFQAVLATFRNVAGQTFTDATKIALDMASVMGTDLQSTAVQLGKALNDPVEGVTALRRVGVSFTEQQLAQIKAMQEAGNLAGAQAIVLAELKNEFGGVAEAMAKTPYGRFKQIGNEIGDVYKAVGNVLLDVGAKFTTAFNVSGVLSRITGYLNGLQGTIGSLADTYIPMIAGGAGKAFTSIVSHFDAIYTHVAPIFYSVFSIASSVFSGIESLVVNHTGGVIGALVGIGAVILGPTVLGAITAIGTAVTAVAGIVLSPIGLIVAAFAAVGAAIGTDGITSALTYITNAVAITAGYIAAHWDTVSSVTATAFNTIYNVIAAAFTAVYNFMAPIVSGIADFFTTNATAMLDVAVEVFTSIYDTIAATLTAAWDIVSGVWQAIGSSWTAGAALVNGTTIGSGVTVRGVFQSIFNVGKWLADGLTASMLIVNYAISHLADTFILVGTQIELSMVKAGNQIVYVFTGIIGPTLTWMAANWKSILTDMATMGVTVFENFASNAVKIITNLPGLISGKVSFSDLWTPLTDGFNATLTTLPNIVDRQAGPLEQHLQHQADQLARSYSQGLGDYMAQHLQRNDQISKAIENGVAGVGKAFASPNSPTAPNIDLPKVQTPKLDPLKLDTSGAVKPLNNLTSAMAATKSTAQNLDAVLSGSADAMKLRYGDAQSAIGRGNLAAVPAAAGAPADAMVGFGGIASSMIPVANASLFGNGSDWLKSPGLVDGGTSTAPATNKSGDWMNAPIAPSSAPLDDGIWRDTNSASGASGSDGNGDVVGQQKQSNNFLSQLLNVTKSQQKLNLVSM